MSTQVYINAENGDCCQPDEGTRTGKCKLGSISEKNSENCTSYNFDITHGDAYVRNR